MKTVLELTRTSIRILQAEGQGKAVRAKQFLIEPLVAGQDMAEQLKRAMSQLKFERAEVIVTIPREQIITRFMKLPASRPDELARMVDLTGKAQLPYPRDQAIAEFQVIEQQAGASTIQLVACHRALIDQHVQLLRQIGLEPLSIIPSSWGLFAWYERFGQRPEAKEPAMVINVDADHTDLVLVSQGRLIFSRSLTQGLTEWQLGTEAIAALSLEIERSLSSLRKELPVVEMNSLVLTGLGPLEQWKGALESHFAKPVAVRSAIDARDLSTLPAAARGSAAIAVGLIAAEPRWLLNLLPKEARRAQSHRRQVRELIVTGALILLSLGLAVGWLSIRTDRQARLTGQIVKSLRELEAMTQQTEHQEQEIAVVEGVLASRRKVAEMLVELFRATPPDIAIETLTFDRSGQKLVVRGNASTTRQVLDYVRALQDTSRYERVELGYSNGRVTARGPRVEFELTGELKTS